MTLISRVEDLIAQGRSDAYICKAFQIRPSQLAGYKAAISRKGEKYIDRLLDTAQRYQMAVSNVRKRINDFVEELNPSQVRNLTSLLEKIIGVSSEAIPEDLEDNSRVSGPATRESIITVVIEYKRQGKPNSDIYKDPRLTHVKDRVIRAYIMQYTKGAYNHRR